MERVREFVLRSLAAGPRTLWDLVAEQQTQHGQLTETLAKMCREGVVDADEGGKLRLLEAGWQECRAKRLDTWQEHRCPACAGRGVFVRGDLEQLQQDFVEIAAGRPSVTAEFDQGVVPAGVATARVALLDERGDLAGKELLLLGDDDLMSVAFMLSGLPRRVVVLEIDKRVTAFLRRVSEKRGWSELEIVDFDAREAFPQHLLGAFDVFFTDPVETVRGITLFLSRCVESLRGDGSAGYFGLTHIESGWAKWLAIQQAALKMNLVLTDVLRDFNQYLFLGEAVLHSTMRIVRESPVPLPPPRRLWYSSSILRVQAVGTPMATITGRVDWGRELYEDEDTI